MRMVLAFLALVALAVAAAPRGRTSTVQNVYAAGAFALPTSGGIYMYTNAAAGTWTLPLSYANNGTTLPGTTYCIRTLGAGAITLNSNALDLVEGLTTYSIPTATSVCFVSDDASWLLYSKSAITVPAVEPTVLPSQTPKPQTTTGISFATTTGTAEGSSSGAGPAPTPALMRKLGGLGHKA